MVSVNDMEKEAHPSQEGLGHDTKTGPSSEKDDDTSKNKPNLLDVNTCLLNIERSTSYIIVLINKTQLMCFHYI